MCGIAGILTADGSPPPPQAAAMQESIDYRGRDGRGIWQGGGAYLMHSRLSIIDIVSGNQPMTDSRGRYVIAFNGEIYNYRELRESYSRQGAVFRTSSDTEVILEGYRLKGESVCGDLNGMFAFAIWDCQEKTMFLARDRMGKKPLFWTWCGGVFAFASTLDAFHGLPGWSGALSGENIAVYCLLSAFPHQRTVYHDAFSLPAASFAHVRPGEATPRITKYWQLRFGYSARRGLADYMEEYRSLLADAIRLRLRSDVPLALTFSGGVDSGTIAALCVRELQTPLRCFTIDYHTEEDPSEETRIAREVAEMLGLDWNYIHYDYRRDLLDELPEAYARYDQPCQQLPLVYAHRLYQAIKPHATVILSGNGADELFTGYIGDEGVYRKALVLQTLASLRPVMKHLPVSDFLRLPLPQAYALSLQSRASLFEDIPGAREAISETARWLAGEAEAAGAHKGLDLKFLNALNISSTDSNFRIPDISGMASQVEVRSPFLDYRMVEFAARLPHRFRVGNPFAAGSAKYLPKKAYQRYVPRHIAWSRKKGMGWNLRWDRSIASDPAFMRQFENAFSAMESRDIPSHRFRAAWQAYSEDIRNGREFSSHSGLMMTGFMLGMWLHTRPAGVR